MICIYSFCCFLIPLQWSSMERSDEETLTFKLLCINRFRCEKRLTGTHINPLVYAIAAKSQQDSVHVRCRHIFRDRSVALLHETRKQSLYCITQWQIQPVYCRVRPACLGVRVPAKELYFQTIDLYAKTLKCSATTRHRVCACCQCRTSRAYTTCRQFWRALPYNIARRGEHYIYGM